MAEESIDLKDITLKKFDMDENILTLEAEIKTGPNTPPAKLSFHGHRDALSAFVRGYFKQLDAKEISNCQTMN